MPVQPKDGVAIISFIRDNIYLRKGDDVGVNLHRFQQDLYLCEARFRIIVKGRQVGCSSALAWEALAIAILYSGRTILFVSASERQATELLEYVKRAFYNNDFGIRLTEETKTSMKFSNGSRILSLPNNPNTVMGFRADDVYVDEFAFYERDREMIDAILPSVSHGGRLTIWSRPAGKSGRFYSLIDEAKRGLNDFVLFEFPYTVVEDETYRTSVLSIRKTMDDASFGSTYMCEFVDDKISFFPYELINKVVNPDLKQTLNIAMELEMGIDFGKKVDSTVITFVELRDGRRLTRTIIEYLGMTYTEQLRQIGLLIDEWNPTHVKIDATGIGERLHEELREKYGGIIVPYIFTTQLKQMLITDLKIAMEDKKIEIPKNEKLITQLHALEKIVNARTISFRHQAGKHDDYVWSLALANHSYSYPLSSYSKSSEPTRKVANNRSRRVTDPFGSEDDF